MDPSDIVFGFSPPTAEICIFLDENVPRTAIPSITAPQSFFCCTLSKRLVERFAEVTGINEWVVSGVHGSPTAYEKRRKKYVEVPSKTAIGDRAHFSFTIPEEYGGRNYPVRSSPDGYEAGEIQVTVRGKTMSLAFSPVEGNVAQQSVGPADANFDETHDAILVALAAGWLPNHTWFDPIQSILMDANIRLSVHVTLDASEFMVARMRAAYNLANRKDVEDDGIKRYGAVIDSNAARTDSRVAANFIDRVIEYVRTGPEQRFLLLRESE